MDARFIRAARTLLRNVGHDTRYLVIIIVLMLATTSLGALPFGASVGTGWIVMQTRYDIESASAYGENRPLIGIGVRGVLGGFSAGIDAAFTATEPVAYVYDSGGEIDSLESRLSSDLIAPERLSYLRFSLAAGHAFEIAAIPGVSVQPSLELFGLRNLAYRSGSTDLIDTWPYESREDVRNALDGVYMGLSGTVVYRINRVISLGARVMAARAVTARVFPGSVVRAPENAEPRRNAWIEIGASVTYTLRPSQ
ncbi:MAG: hypothetical protein EA426_03915 [Spirochaetaceae bacterium]|nr:MAG: hypothetical protein EA426_03915 [Spirochaetaceae bacterium]